ncbi:MAG: DUF4349 domain-containing protein [Pseudonocardia sp.]|nr:DUF4349 domain-containing protein [Pseudonocardia sp.]
MKQRIGRTRPRLNLRAVATALAVLGVLAGAVSCSSGGAASSSTAGGAPPLVAPADSGAAPDRGVAAAPEQAGADQPAAPLSTERAVVRTAHLGLDTEDLSAAVRTVRGIATTANGFVASERQSGAGGATITVRVPAASLDQVIDQVAALGTVTSRRSTTTDVTDQVIDLDARVASQQASVDRIRALLARAESIADITAIESQLAQREGELNSLKNRLAALEGKVALATLTVDIDGPGAVPPNDPPGFLTGIEAGWQSLVRIAVLAGAVVGFVLPYLPVLAAAAAIVWMVRRNARRRSPAPAAAGGSPGRGGDA